MMMKALTERQLTIMRQLISHNSYVSLHAISEKQQSPPEPYAATSPILTKNFLTRESISAEKVGEGSQLNSLMRSRK